MAKYKVSANTVFKITNTGGTLIDLSAYIDSIDALGKEVASLDVTAFTDAAERIIAGIENSQEWSISGHFDDTGTTGPDVVLAPLVGSLKAFEFYPIGTTAGRRKFSGTALCLAYSIPTDVKGRVEYTARFKLDGTMTVGTA